MQQRVRLWQCHARGTRPSHTDRKCLLFTAGPISSFLVISDPAAAKHVLRATDNPKRPLYDKGLVAEVRYSFA